MLCPTDQELQFLPPIYRRVFRFFALHSFSFKLDNSGEPLYPLPGSTDQKQQCRSVEGEGRGRTERDLGAAVHTRNPSCSGVWGGRIAGSRPACLGSIVRPPLSEGRTEWSRQVKEGKGEGREGRRDTQKEKKRWERTESPWEAGQRTRKARSPVTFCDWSSLQQAPDKPQCGPLDKYHFPRLSQSFSAPQHDALESEGKVQKV